MHAGLCARVHLIRTCGVARIWQLRLYAAVSADDSTWTIGADSAGQPHVCVSMEKLYAVTWPQADAVD